MNSKPRLWGPVAGAVLVGASAMAALQIRPPLRFSGTCLPPVEGVCPEGGPRPGTGAMVEAKLREVGEVSMALQNARAYLEKRYGHRVEVLGVRRKEGRVVVEAMAGGKRRAVVADAKRALGELPSAVAGAGLRPGYSRPPKPSAKSALARRRLSPAKPSPRP